MEVLSEGAGQQDFHDPALVRDIIERRDQAFDELPLDDVVLFLAHTQNDRSARSLAHQTKRPVHSVERSIDYVRAKLESVFPEYAEIYGPETQEERVPDSVSHNKGEDNSERL
jgi:hypothetical protein